MRDVCPTHANEPEGDDGHRGRRAPWLGGKRYWQTRDEVEGNEAFQQRLYREFPRYAGEWLSDLDRRSFLKVIASSVALAGAAGCFKRPEQKIYPYVQPPEMGTPGVPLHFATALPVFGLGRGVIVRSDEGKPTKIDGNPNHPASLGATDAFTQAMLLDLYDPDRSQSVACLGQVSSWDNLTLEPRVGLGNKFKQLRENGGKGLCLVTESIASPTLAFLMNDLLAKLPEARWHVHDPSGPSDGEKRAIYHIDRAKVILSLDSNLLAEESGSVRYARDFADGRRVRNDRREMNRLYAMETMFTVTGAMADHRLALKPSRITVVADAIAKLVKQSPVDSGLTAEELAFARAAVADLLSHAGTSLVVASERGPAELQAIAHSMNSQLGNIGKTVGYIASPLLQPPAAGGLGALISDMDAGAVDLLVILEANPVYSCPGDLDFAAALKRFSTTLDASGQPRHVSVRHGLYDDETSELCHWHLPAAHPLESWGDIRAFDGTVSIQQPLIAPLYEGRSTVEVLHWLRQRLIAPETNTTYVPGVQSGHEVVKSHWRSNEDWKALSTATDFDIFWETCLHDGIVPRTAYAESQEFAVTSENRGEESGFELHLAPDPTIWDGRFANNAWMQELPKPISKLTWDNAVFISVKTAHELKLTNFDKVEVSSRNGMLEAAIWVMAGHADDCATLHLGYGRWRGGRVATSLGFNAYRLQRSANLKFTTGVSLRKLNVKYQFACTQGNQVMDGRDLIRVGTPEYAYATAARSDEHDGAPGSGIRHPLPVVSMYPDTPDHAKGATIDPRWQAWGMVIDNNTCIGCNACVVACQAENNIPVVGKDQVSRGRELHWLRIDTYFQGAIASNGTCEEAEATKAFEDSTNRGVSPSGASAGAGLAGKDSSTSQVHAFFEPVPCMHCEKAPCEVVCPVGATLHDVEGINNMVYNRCVGTRYCSNNCPYKVRRFNFLQYADETTPSLALGRNPEVTVRSRGVMEKCTYCIQRISSGRITAKKANAYDAAGKPIIADQSIRTACQQVCPTQAIVFGDISDSSSEVYKLKSEPLNFALLEELQTEPRTTYLWRLTNPNPSLT